MKLDQLPIVFTVRTADGVMVVTQSDKWEKIREYEGPHLTDRRIAEYIDFHSRLFAAGMHDALERIDMRERG